MSTTTIPRPPAADRPRIPREYGVPTTKKSLLDWADVEDRLAEARAYWVVTSGRGGHPRARPVDGVWFEGRLIVGGSPETRWVRDLIANPHVAVHLDGLEVVVILEGEAEVLGGVDRATAERLAAASNAKYGYGMDPSVYETGPGPFSIRLRTGLAWSGALKDMTRFRFPED